MRNRWCKYDKDYEFFDIESLKIIRKFILENPGNIFEGACGTGYLIHSLRKDGFKNKYLGSDFSNGMLRNSKKNNPEEEFIEINLKKKLPFNDNQFDISIVNNGMYYILDYQPVIKELKRISKQYIILTFVNNFSDHEDRLVTPLANSYVYNKSKFYNYLKELNLDIVEDIQFRESYPNRGFNKIILILRKTI